MDYRLLGQTGLRVSELTFGTMSFGGEADEAAAAAMFSRCRDAGINMFDTADVYQGGASEEILGRLIKDCRHEVVIASKGYFPTGDDVNARGSSRFHLVRTVEDSLRRLQTDRIDVYYLHRFDESTPLAESLRALDDLVRAGKILYPAASNFAAWQVSKALGIAAAGGLSPLCAVQPMYNLVKRQAEVEILPMAAAENIAVFPYGPMGGGLLSGKYGIDRRPDAGRLMSLDSYRVRYGDQRYYQVAESFTVMARDLGHHPGALAIAWVGSHPAVTAPILGARSVEQLEPLLGAAEIDMTDELRASIAALSPAPPPATDRSEEAELASPFK